MSGYLVVGFTALAITYVMTPVVRWFAVKVNLIDRPSDRKVHARPTPTLGGLALLFGLIGGGVVARFLPGTEFNTVFATTEPMGLAAGALVIFALGAVDDVRALPAPVKLAGQTFAAGLLFLSGVKMNYLLLPTQTLSLSDDVSVLVTVIWLVAMMNAINLVDGLDGLAAGIVAIAASSFFVYTYQIAESGGYLTPSAPLLAIIIVGATLGFLRHNFYPAKIFMGDSGSMLLGLALGGATIAGIGSAPSIPLSNSGSAVFLAYFPLLIPLAVLALPIADSLLAIVRRARKRRNVFLADKQHIHHRLMDLGHGHRQAVIVMYIWSALAAGAGLAFSFLDSSGVIFALPVAVAAIVIYTLFPLLTKLLDGRT